MTLTLHRATERRGDGVLWIGCTCNPTVWTSTARGRAYADRHYPHRKEQS